MSEKHLLKNSGAPFTSSGDLVNGDPKVTSGVGRAICSCGWSSDELETGTARKKAHAEHKADAATDEPEQDVQTDVEDVDDDLLGEVAEDTDEEPVEPDVVLEYGNAPKHFWKPLAVTGALAIGAIYDVEVVPVHKDKTVELYGERADEAASVIEAVWVGQKEPFRAWKKTPEVKDRDRKIELKEIYESYDAFLADFCKGVAASLTEAGPKKGGTSGYKAGVNWVANGGLEDAPAEDSLI